MTTLKIMAIRDRQLDAFIQPFPMQSLGQAIRMFRDEINNPQSDLAKHPEDYDLYHVANFHQETGRFETFENPVQVAIGSNLVDLSAPDIIRHKDRGINK